MLVPFYSMVRTRFVPAPPFYFVPAFHFCGCLPGELKDDGWLSYNGACTHNFRPLSLLEEAGLHYGGLLSTTFF
jgi:hypothetical protein